MKRSGRWLTLLLALVLASVAAIGAYSLTTNDPESDSVEAAKVETATPVPSSDVVVALTNIPAAVRITDEMVQVQDIPTYLKNEHAMTDPALVVGKVAAVPLMAGEQILDSRITDVPVAETNTFAYTVPVGKRAISLVFDEVVGAGALVQPGDFVDVIGYFEIKVKDLSLTTSDEDDDSSADGTPTEQPDYTQYVTTYVVQDVQVLAVSQAMTPDEVGVGGQSAEPTETASADEPDTTGEPVARPEARSVTLAVSPEQAQRLLLASQTVENESGGLRLAVRAPGDTTTTDIGPAQLGTIPVGDLLGDVDQAMVPNDLVIVSASFTQSILPQGDVLEFRATVKNISDHTVSSSKEAPPEFQYTQGVAYDALGYFGEEGTVRIGLNVAGAFPNQFPYRWSFGADLAPGESVEVVGSVILTEPTASTRYWLGIIQEPNEVTQDGVAVTDVTVLTSESGTIRSRTADLQESPDATSATVGTLDKGATFEIVDASGAWFLVRTADQEGWVLASKVRVPPLDGASSDQSP